MAAVVISVRLIVHGEMSLVAQAHAALQSRRAMQQRADESPMLWLLKGVFLASTASLVTRPPIVAFCSKVGMTC